jgi:hypothetical protein
MTWSYEDELIRLELLSTQISDLVFVNNFNKIEELDLERRKIINKIKNSKNFDFKNRVKLIINNNNNMVDGIEIKMRDFTSKHYKLSKRLKFYSLSN